MGKRGGVQAPQRRLATSYKAILVSTSREEKLRKVEEKKQTAGRHTLDTRLVYGGETWWTNKVDRSFERFGLVVRAPSGQCDFHDWSSHGTGIESSLELEEGVSLLRRGMRCLAAPWYAGN